MRWSLVGIAAAVLLVGPSAVAQFRAADLVVVPVAASLPGLNGSDWHTDVEIYNADTVPIDVEVVFLPSGGIDNSYWYTQISNHLGWSSDPGFGHVDSRLQAIPAGQSVILDDVVTPNWGSNIKGALLFFGSQTGTFTTTTPPGGVPAKLIVHSRTYTLGQTSDNMPTTYGQSIPGLPWYLYVDPFQESNGLNQVVFTGLREDASYRTAVGLVNISDPLTSIGTTLTLNASDGTQLVQRLVFLVPLSHVQYDQAAYSLFGLTTDQTVVGATLTVKVATWQSTAAEPAPALISYVSRIDNTTNDPVYIEQSFTGELNWDCVFNGNCTSAGAQQLLSGFSHRNPLLPTTR
jgi:hypothetical protein